MKIVSCKVVKSAPFVERRFRNDPLKNKYRRTGDIPSQNTVEKHDINSVIYKFTSGKPKTSNQTGPGRRLLDCYV
jgi:hypothetical protein